MFFNYRGKKSKKLSTADLLTLHINDPISLKTAKEELFNIIQSGSLKAIVDVSISLSSGKHEQRTSKNCARLAFNKLESLTKAKLFIWDESSGDQIRNHFQQILDLFHANIDNERLAELLIIDDEMTYKEFVDGFFKRILTAITALNKIYFPKFNQQLFDNPPDSPLCSNASKQPSTHKTC